MAYITYQDYVGLYGTPPVSESEFPVYAERASDVIDSITMYRIAQGGGISALPALTQTLVQKATGAQILYFTQNGIDTVLTGQTGQGFAVGKVRVDGVSGDGRRMQASMIVSPWVVSLLEQTGLMDRRTPCLGPYQSGYLGIW